MINQNKLDAAQRQPGYLFRKLKHFYDDDGNKIKVDNTYINNCITTTIYNYALFQIFLNVNCIPIKNSQESIFNQLLNSK